MPPARGTHTKKTIFLPFCLLLRNAGKGQPKVLHCHLLFLSFSPEKVSLPDPSPRHRTGRKGQERWHVLQVGAKERGQARIFPVTQNYRNGQAT